jgi:hypothetical protein
VVSPLVLTKNVTLSVGLKNVGIFDVIQGTFRVSQVTFGVIQGTFDVIQMLLLKVVDL